MKENVINFSLSLSLSPPSLHYEIIQSSNVIAAINIFADRFSTINLHKSPLCRFFGAEGDSRDRVSRHLSRFAVVIFCRCNFASPAARVIPYNYLTIRVELPGGGGEGRVRAGVSRKALAGAQEHLAVRFRQECVRFPNAIINHSTVSRIPHSFVFHDPNFAECEAVKKRKP